jgi:hypothetical protein
MILFTGKAAGCRVVSAARAKTATREIHGMNGPRSASATTLPGKAEQFAICLALVLAAAAAIMSGAGQSDKMQRLMQWLMLSTGPETDAIVGAIGEHAEVLLSP